MKCVTILDFEDSFTFNIASFLFLKKKINPEIISLPKIDTFLENLAARGELDYSQLIILGAGPSHPDKYRKLFPILEKLQSRVDLFWGGICLGHQILWLLRGAKIAPSLNPVHGKTVPIRIPKWPHFPPRSWGMRVDVQGYNSWGVTLQNGGVSSEQFNTDLNGEVNMGRFERGITYQFHPESVGTTFPSLFFDAMVDSVYNTGYGAFNHPFRGLSSDSIEV